MTSYEVIYKVTVVSLNKETRVIGRDQGVWYSNNLQVLYKETKVNPKIDRYCFKVKTYLR